MRNDSDDPRDPDDPQEPHDRDPIDPFESARVRPRSPDIHVAWSVDDMLSLRPDWTLEQCEAFLRRHASKFAAGMLQMGLTVLVSMASDPRFVIGSNSSNGDGKHAPPES